MIDTLKIWEQLRKGQPQALEQLFKQYYQDLYQYGRHFSGHNQLIQDQIQQLFLKLWEKHPNLPAVQSVKAYLLRSLRNILLDDVKAARRAEQQLAQQEITHYASAEQTLILAEQSTIQQQALAEVLAQLSPRQREIIHLRFYQAIPYTDIAQLLDMEYQSVRNTVYRALKALRKNWPNEV